MSNDASLDEALNVERLKEKLPLRPKVLRIHHEPYTDTLGARELMIIAVLANDTKDEDMTTANLQAIRDAVVAALHGDHRYPYVRFLTEEELTAPDEE